MSVWGWKKKLVERKGRGYLFSAESMTMGSQSFFACSASSSRVYTMIILDSPVKGTHWLISPYVAKWCRRVLRTSGWKKCDGTGVMTSVFVPEDGGDGEGKENLMRSAMGELWRRCGEGGGASHLIQKLCRLKLTKHAAGCTAFQFKRCSAHAQVGVRLRLTKSS